MLIDLSIIIPIYNSGQHLKSCLNSITIQIKKKIEVILVNDKSTDNSYKICKKFKKKYKFIKLINLKKNKGVSFCRNIGLKKSKGKFVFFVDSDDLLNANSLNNIQDRISKFPNMDLFFHKNLRIPHKKIDNNEFIFNIKKNSILSNIKNFDQFRATCWNYIINRKFIFRNKIFFKNIITFEDQVFVSQILCLASNYKIFNEVNYIWRNLETNSLGKITGYLTAFSCLKILVEISKFIKEQNLNLDNIKKKFLYSRIKFTLIRFFQNILICNSFELGKLSLYLKKNKLKFKNLKILNNRKNFIKLLTKLRFNKLKDLKEKKKLILKNKVKNKEKIVLICLGYYGKIILRVLINLLQKVDLIIDDNKIFTGKSQNRVKINNYLFLKKNRIKYKNHLLLICNNKKKDINLIKKRLLKMKFEKKNISHINI